LTTQDQLRPITGRQNLYATGAGLALSVAGFVALACPGAVPTALASRLLWRVTDTPLARRFLTAVVSAGLLLVAAPVLVFAWPWRLAGTGIAPSASLGLSVSAVVHSLAAEATLGPALALLTEVGLMLRARTILGQVHVNAKDHSRRAPALQPGYQPQGGPARQAGLAGSIRLGIDQAGALFDFAISDIGEHVLLPGATGSGKTTTIVRLASGAVANGYSVAIVDGKAGPLAGEARKLAERSTVPFVLVHPDDPDSAGYDVCTGDPSDVANKLVGAFPFSSEADIYKQMAMQALPVIVRAIQASGEPVTLDSICEALSTGGFALLKRKAPPEFGPRLDNLQEDARSELAQSGYTGLRFRLRAISEGKFAEVINRRPALDWGDVSSHPGVTYLGLPTTAAAEDVELFGRVIVQDLKQLCARRLRAIAKGVVVSPLLVVFDEFTALREAPQIRDLLLQARQALMPTVVAQQYLPLDPEIRAAVLQSGVLVCHRVNAEDAEALANELGTRKVPYLTSQVDFDSGEVDKGSVRPVDEYRIHPNVLRELDVGQAVVYARHSHRRAIVRIQRDDL